MASRHLPHLAYNGVSGVGAVLASVAFLAAVTLLVLSIFSGLASPYLGIFIYLFLPALVVLGLILIPVGMWLKHRRLIKGGVEETPHWPRIDLNDRQMRNGAIVFGVGTLLFVVGSAVGTYEGYQYTESVAFCGKLCHTVMKPEYVAHRTSPHAAVKCTTCHVGPGVGWYGRSKVRGVSRVYEVIASSYPRPIPTPISDLRPVEVECRQCHWPEALFGGRRWTFHNHLYDEKNTYWPVTMVIHTGGGDPSVDQTGGIHWYMLIGYKIEYIARDEKRQDIPWVRATNKKTGEVTVYQDETNPLSKEEIASASPRTFDCIDCHNRPAHAMHAPDHAIDLALFLDEVPSDLPDAKKATVSAMTGSYENEDAARSGIAKSINDYYQKNQPDVYKKDKTRIDKAIQATQDRYSRNIFPYMKADWEAYPDNLGHFYYPGCFRCHLGNHESESGQVISHDCTACHDIVAEGSGSQARSQTSPAGIPFEHPVDIGGLWDKLPCSQCHTGGVMSGGPPSPAPSPEAPPSTKAPPKSPSKTAPEAGGLPTLSSAEKAKVQKVYRDQCASCHADDGSGAAAMRAAMPQLPDLTTAKWQSDRTNQQIEDAVLNGKGAMPGFNGKLDGITTQQMAAYVRQFGQQSNSGQSKPSEKKPSGAPSSSGGS